MRDQGRAMPVQAGAGGPGWQWKVVQGLQAGQGLAWSSRGEARLSSPPRNPYPATPSISVLVSSRRAATGGQLKFEFLWRGGSWLRRVQVVHILYTLRVKQCTRVQWRFENLF